MMWAVYNGKRIGQKAADALMQRPFFTSPYSLIETMRWQKGALFLSSAHYQRLATGMRLLGYLPGHNHRTNTFLNRIDHQIHSLTEAPLARIRIQVAPSGKNARPHCLITCSELTAQTAPLLSGIAGNVFKQRHPLSFLKTGDRRIYNKAAAEALRQGWDEALLRNDAGRIIESTIANIFWIKNGMVHTPPLGEGCVAGVLRGFLLVKLPGWGFNCQEALLTKKTLAQADEVFLVNSLRGIRPVQEIRGVGNYHERQSVYLKNRLSAS